MLGTFPKALNSQAATYHGFFPNGNFPNLQLPKCPTRELLKWRLLKSVLASALGPQHIFASAFGHPLHRAAPQKA